MPPREFVDCITDDLLGQGVFVFTPSGAPMRLPKVRRVPQHHALTPQAQGDAEAQTPAAEPAVMCCPLDHARTSLDSHDHPCKRHPGARGYLRRTCAAEVLSLP